MRSERSGYATMRPSLCAWQALSNHATFLQIDHAHDHRSLRIKWHVYKTPSLVEPANLVVDRMRQHAEASDLARRQQGRRQRKQQQRARMTPALMRLVNRQLP